MTPVSELKALKERCERRLASTSDDPAFDGAVALNVLSELLSALIARAEKEAEGG